MSVAAPKNVVRIGLSAAIVSVADERPRVLVVHLKRFAYDPKVGAMFKRSDCVRLNSEIDISECISPLRYIMDAETCCNCRSLLYCGDKGEGSIRHELVATLRAQVW